MLLRKGAIESAFEKACLQQATLFEASNVLLYWASRTLLLKTIDNLHLQQATLFRDHAQEVEEVFGCFNLVQCIRIERENGRERVQQPL